MRWVVAVVGIGCYSPGFEAGTPCDTSCPGDLVCIERVCREPGDVPPDAPDPDAPADLDLDGDGVMNADDNCPQQANSDQHDEDQDSNGDACDPCPHVSGSLADGDGDGVGDACDPQPEVAKQVLRFFDPFTSERPQWLHGSHTTYVDGTLRMSPPDGTDTFSNLDIATAESRIVTGGTVASILTAPPHQLSIEFGPNQDRTELHLVQIFDNGSSPGAVSINKKNGNLFPELVETTYAGALPLGAWELVIDSSVATQTITVQSTLAGLSKPTITASTATAPILRAGPNINVYVRRADFRFDYLLVIDTVP